MIFGAEILNDNGISVVAAAFFTGLFAFLGVIAKLVSDAKGAARNASHEATKANKSATQANQSATAAESNTQSVSNGFAAGVVRRLERIEQQNNRCEIQNAEISNALRAHMEWHLNNKTQEK